jgi:hypothetical protein
MKRKILDMKKLWFVAPLLFCLPSLHAQSAIDFGVGFGTAFDSSNGQGIDNANSLLNPFGSCTPGTGDAFCQKTPSLSGFFLGFGGDVMFKEHFGVGAEFNVQPARETYGPLQSRVSFFDVNGVYEPIIKKRYNIQIQGGIGDSKTSFAYSSSSCVGTAVCSNSTQAVGNSTHFQVHAGVGVQINITDHIFLRPQFDLHYTPGFTNQWGSNAATDAMVYLGYHFGSN